MHKRTLSFLAASAVVSAMSVAEASFPTAVWVKPTKVEYMPDKPTATSVVIHGSFLLWDATAMAYRPPASGYVYYACPVGSEKTCRMEWGELEALITTGPGDCRGYGAQTQGPGTLVAEGTPLGTADVYPIQMGVVQGFSPCDTLKTFNETGAGGAGGGSGGTAGAAGTGGTATAGAGGSTAGAGGSTAGAGGSAAGAGGSTAGAGGSTAGAGGSAAGAGGSGTAGTASSGAGGSSSAGAGGSPAAGAGGSGTAGSGTAGASTGGTTGSAGKPSAGAAGATTGAAGATAAAAPQAEDDGGCTVGRVRPTDVAVLIPLTGLALAWAARRRRR